MFESSLMVTLTDWAMKRTGKLHGERLENSESSLGSYHCFNPSEHEPKMWDDLKGHFVDHIDEINAELQAAGRPVLGSTDAPSSGENGTNGVNGKH